jgi:hypothetical protein
MPVFVVSVSDDVHHDRDVVNRLISPRATARLRDHGFAPTHSHSGRG